MARDFGLVLDLQAEILSGNVTIETNFFDGRVSLPFTQV
jgi:hypothetical protein